MFALLALLFGLPALSSCCTAKPPCWHTQAIPSATPPGVYLQRRLALGSTLFNPFEVEVVTTPTTEAVYINSENFVLEQQGGLALVQFVSSKESFSSIAWTLQGGQRFLLPPEGANWLLGALKEQQDITIQIAALEDNS